MRLVEGSSENAAATVNAAAKIPKGRKIPSFLSSIRRVTTASTTRRKQPRKSMSDIWTGNPPARKIYGRETGNRNTRRRKRFAGVR